MKHITWCLKKIFKSQNVSFMPIYGKMPLFLSVHRFFFCHAFIFVMPIYRKMPLFLSDAFIFVGLYL